MCILITNATVILIPLLYILLFVSISAFSLCGWVLETDFCLDRKTNFSFDVFVFCIMYCNNLFGLNISELNYFPCYFLMSSLNILILYCFFLMNSVIGIQFAKKNWQTSLTLSVFFQVRHVCKCFTGLGTFHWGILLIPGILHRLHLFEVGMHNLFWLSPKLERTFCWCVSPFS